MKMKNYFRFVVFALLGLLNAQWASAQNVTISPNSGSLIAALTEGNEQGFENGWSAMWRHEQLPLTFTVSDHATLTDGGEIADPAGNIREHDFGGNLGKRYIVAGGTASDLYCVLSLPKGYRIKEYKIVLLNNVNYATIGEDDAQMKLGYAINEWGNYTNTQRSITKRMYETDKYYNIESPKASSELMGGSNSTNEFVIHRISQNDDDMSNQIYFRLNHNNGDYDDAFYAVTIKSFEIWFTAEGTFESDVKPDDVGQARSVVQAPFQTSKIDIGDMKVEEKNGKKFFAYNYNNVRDLTAYNVIYQSNAIQNGVPTEGTEAKTIYPLRVDNKDVFAFGNNTYYVETPIQVHTQSGLEAPVGYRIVGARFNYLWGTQTGSTTEERTNYYITYTSGGKTYYLNDQLHFTENKFAWFYNSSNQNIYTGSGDNIRYLSCTGSGGTRTLTFSTDNGGYYNLQVFTRNGNTYIGWPQMTYYGYSGYVVGNTTGATATMVRNNGAPTNAAIWVVQTENVTIPAFNPGAYTLKVFDKEGNYEEDESTGKPTKGLKAVVNSASDAGGILELENLNNDAVKFQISGLENGKQALVSVTLLLQALNPYIDQMNIVCHDPNNQLTLSKPFTADDFSVSGGSFKFYIPEDYKNTLLTFSFSDLYSSYGDETYSGGSNEHFGRYSFVTSDYFTPINGKGNDGLYDEAYDPDATYTNKVVTSTAGNIRFKFNNAEDLGNTSGNTSGYLEETPFSVADYIGSEDPDGGSDVGAFVNCQLAANLEGVSKSGTYYVFTADETRYNIAPTTAWQHRSYAFYRMDIELEAKSYTPNLTWTKVYDKDKTFYGDGKTNSQWGLKLQTMDDDVIVEDGYLTVDEILKAINARTKDDTAAPKETNQILYIDGSELYSIVNSSITEDGTTTTEDLSSLKQNLGLNAIVFLPENMTTTLDNFAYKTGSGSFHAGRHIVLTDKNPFYSPYDIQVDAANYAKYTRQITKSTYTDETYATVILPFEIALVNGQHADDYGTLEFLQMNEKNATADDYNYMGKTMFFSKTNAEKVEANTPYALHVMENKGEDGVFTVNQPGAVIIATPAAAKSDNSLFSATEITSTGNLTDKDGHVNSYSFSHKGSFSGFKIPKTSPTTFYFANGGFYSSAELKSTYTTVDLLPFRSVYEVTSGGSAKVGFLHFIEGENYTTGIVDIEKKNYSGIAAGDGTITITAGAAGTYRIFSAAGQNANNVVLKAGETRTVNVPAGVYLVNGVKVLVK